VVVKKLLVLMAIFLVAAGVQAESFYWLRGTDLPAGIEREENFFMVGTPPGPAATKTVVSADTASGTGTVGKWYSTVFSQDYSINGEVFFLANKLTAPTDRTKVRFVLNEFIETTQERNLVAASEWVKAKGFRQAAAVIPQSVTVKEKSRLELALEFMEEGTTGKISLVLDEPLSFHETVLSTPTGIHANASGVDGTAVIVVDECRQEEIACTQDNDCANLDTLATATCENPGTCRAECVFEKCSPLCTANASCSDENPLTADECLQNGSCTASCKNTACSVECSQNAQCSDSDSATKDECVFPATCVSFCRNEKCAGSDCTIEQEFLCGDSVCAKGEACESDCVQGKTVLFGLQKDGEFFLRGEEIKFSVEPRGFERIDNVSARGFFGEKELLDNGVLPDDVLGDGIFSAEVVVGKNAEGTQTVVFEVNEGEEIYRFSDRYVVAPVLELLLQTDKTEYAAGDAVKISGSLNKKGVPLSGKNAHVQVFFNGGLAAEESLAVNEFGFFSLDYRTSVLDSDGKISVTADFADEYENSAVAETQVVFLNPQSSPEQNAPGKIPVQYGPKGIGIPMEWLVVLGVLGLLAFAIAGSRMFSKKKEKTAQGKKNEEKIIREIKSLQQAYFKTGFMPRKDYDEKILKLENELKEARGKK